MRFKLPKFRVKNPFKNPLSLKQIHKNLFKKDRKFKLSWRLVGKIALYFLGVFTLLVVFLFAWFAKDLPTPGKIRSLTTEASTRLFDRNMQPLYTISGEKKRILIDSQEIPEIMRQAVIALEDRDFYQHPGIDARSIVRAIVTGEGGGSTITQQYVRNAILDDRRVTYTRKIREIILAIQLEFLYSKDEIMTMYLNEVPFGGNNYGVEAASRSYFGKPAKELTLYEAAMLAAIIQRPTTFSPYGQRVDQLKIRRDYALTVMAELGFITTAQAEEAQSKEISVLPKRDSIIAPHFVLYTKEWLVRYFEKELGDAQLAEQKVESGGLTVVTTLDLEKQKIAEEVVANSKERLARFRASNAGTITIDPKRGDILSMVGSIDFFQEQFGAFNVTTASRQPGSSFKPIVYAASFKDRFNPATNLFDLRTDFGGGYTPNNYDGRFRGPVTIRHALGNSLNIPAVKILALIGIDRALQTASDMGITTLTDKDRYGLSLVLGGGEIKLLELTAAYGVFANNGVFIPPTPALKIIDRDENVILNRETVQNARQVLDPQIAYQINSILADNEARRPTFNFAMRSFTLNNRPAAAKTGTTDEFRDAWMVGYTPQLVTGVWAGNNDNSPMTAVGGSGAAAPIWDEIMERFHRDLPVENFVRPEGIQEIQVDRLSNLLPVEGSEVIRDVFATWQVPRERDSIRRQVRVCRENGLLAGDDIPDELVEMRTFSFIRSEKPDNPNWENPVRAWALANGFNHAPPTEICVLSTTAPTITITSPTNNESVSGNITISASASAFTGVASVDFLINNTLLVSDSEFPYQTTFNTSQLSQGQNTITAVVKSNSGSTARTSITIIVSNDQTPPSNVTGFNGVASSGSVFLTWINPTDSDFRLVRIYVFQDNNNALVRTIEINSPTQFVTIPSLLGGRAYRFTARSVDTAQNESSGVSIILTPLP